MSELVWTTEKPTKAGWYWWRKSKTHEKRIFQIEEDSEMTGHLMTRRMLAILDRDPHTLGGEWAGPIPEPKECKT